MATDHTRFSPDYDYDYDGDPAEFPYPGDIRSAPPAKAPVKPSAPTKPKVEPPPVRKEPPALWKCKACPNTSSNGFDLCYPVRIA